MTTRGWLGLSFLMMAGLAVSSCAPPTGDDMNGGAPADDSAYGQVQVALTNVPPMTACIRFTITAGTTSSTQAFAVTAGTPAMMSIKGLPPSTALSLRGEAFAQACTALTAASLPTWISDPVAVNLMPGQVAMLNFVLKPAASINGTVDFLQLTVAPTTFNFGNNVVGVPSPTTGSFTFKNVGTAATGVLAASLIGGNAADFSITGNTCNVALAAMPATPPSCTVQVKMVAVTAGNKSASVQVTGMPGGTITATLAGVAFTPPKLDITPGAVNFGVVAVGPMGQPVGNGFVVVNSGGVMSGPVTLTASDPSFIIAAGCNAPLGPGASCPFNVTFAPMTVGPKAATLTAATTAPGINGTAMLTGTAVLPAAIVAMPMAVTFSGVVFPMSKLSDPIVVHNTGGLPTSQLQVGTPPNSAFTVENDGCTGASVLAGGSCMFQVRYTPIPLIGSSSSAVPVMALPFGGTLTINLQAF